MAKFEDFDKGARVRHASMGLGVVSAVTDREIEVAYDEWKSGGKYDHEWFRIHPATLIRVE